MSSYIDLAFENESKIPEEEQAKYIEILSDIVSSEKVTIFNSAIEIAPSDLDGWKYLWAMAHATYLQRADAYVKWRLSYGYPDERVQS